MDIGAVRLGRYAGVMVNRPALQTAMALTLILFFGSAVLIYLSCEYFVNGVEWLGKRLAFGQTAAEREIGIGAALGGPLALSTLAYGVVGLTLMGSTRLKVRRKEALDV